METSDSVDTPMVEKSNLDAVLQRKEVDPTRYRRMISSLLYLTANRPDLVFVVCMCAWYQVKPTEKHLHVVKRIFRYLRGTINMDTRRGTSGSMQLLGDRLVSWSSKKHKSTAISSTEAEFIALSGCQRQQAVRDEKLVPSADRVKISATNMRIESTVPQKEETFQVILDIIKASPCFKAFTIIADVPEIYMQQFWFTIKKTKKTPLYKFGLDDKKFSVYVELFRKILDICPRVPNEDFGAPSSEEDLLAFLIE
ncbi:hypothetical protein Tco_0058520 [Tanacetum coccineum]